MFSFLAYNYLTTTAILGFQLTNFLGRYRLPNILLIGASFPVGMVFLSITTLILNPFFGCNRKNGVIQLFIAILISTRLHFLSSFKFNKNIQIKKLVSFIFISIFAFAMIYSYKIAFYHSKENEWISTSENDMWLELAAIQSFHRGYNRFASPFKLSSLLKLEFGIPNPIVINSTLHSEYLPCVYEALLLDSDLEVNQVIFVLTSILTFSIIIIVYSYTLKVFDSHIAAVLSTPIVFFLGGYAIVNALDNNSRLSSSIEYRFNTGLGQYQPWGHEMLHCLLTSRLCLLCLALSSLVYSFLEFNLDCSAGIIAWIVIFLRPPSAAVLFFVYLFYKWQKIHIRAFFAVVAVLLLYIQKIHVTFGVMYSNHWPYQPIIGYLWNIFGIIPIGCILGYLFTKKIAPISAIASLITILFVNLQESHRFNFFAVITSVYPVLAAFFAGGFMDLTFISKKKSKQGAIGMLIVLIIASSCLSGVVGYIHRLDQTIEVFPDNTAKETGLWIAKNTKSNTTFLSIVDRVWTPSVFYAGRRELTTTDQAFQAVPFKPINYIVALNEWMTGNVTSWNMTDVILIQNTAQYADVIKRKADAAMKLLYSNDDYFVYTN